MIIIFTYFHPDPWKLPSRRGKWAGLDHLTSQKCLGSVHGAMGPWSELDRSTMIDVRIFLKFVQGQRSFHFKVKTICVQLLGESWRNVSSALKPEVGSSWNS